MASAFSAKRCLNHLQREAVARCPECREFFCRECVAEHDDRIICSACLRKLAGKKDRPRRSAAALLQPVAFFTSVLVAWFFFYVIGRLIGDVPTRFHEGTVWESTFSEDDGG